MANTLHHGDLPENIDFGESVAVDCETMGLNVSRDRLCLVQLGDANGNVHLVQIPLSEDDAGEEDIRSAPNLCALLGNEDILKIFHFGRFDIAVLFWNLGVLCEPVYCTKIVSRLTRTYTDRHGLKDLCRELLKIDLSKQQQSSDWGAASLSKEQIKYAAADVLHLHALKERLDEMLDREGRAEIAESCFRFLPTRAILDLAGWADEDIFSH